MTEDIEILIKWLQVREEFEEGFELTTIDQLKADIDHSALLERMLDGEVPLPKPPPRAFSCPWYSLVDEGYGRPYEVEEIDDKTLLIDQDTWTILEERSFESWIVSYETMPDTKWEVWCEGEKDPPTWEGKDDGEPAPCKLKDWRIKRQDTQQWIINGATTTGTAITDTTITYSTLGGLGTIGSVWSNNI